jgi:hypothetical protein
VGADESPGFLSQTEIYTKHLKAHGVPVIEVPLPGHDHFSAWNEVMDPSRPLTKAVLKMMGL